MLSPYGLRELHGTWAPVLTADTPGNLSVAYTTQVGTWRKVGSLVVLQWAILTSTWTHTTASGTLKITGRPFAPSALTGYEAVGSLVWSGITKATYTAIQSRIVASGSVIQFRASGSGVAAANLQVTDAPTGGTVELSGSLAYFMD